jgi:lysozyme
MKPRHQVTRAAIDLIKAFEGYRRHAARLANGRWTIGYGHTLTAREGAEVSEKDAAALLTYDLIAVAHAVNDQTYTPLTQNQFDALCAFAFNIGLEKFRVCSVLRLINQGQLLQAACGMELWRKADFQGERIVIDALVRRRAAEKNLFLTPPAGWVPAPSPILPPNLDTDLERVVPLEKPAVVTTTLEGLDARPEREPQPFSDGLTATQRAAAAVTARLQKIFPDDPERVAGPGAVPVAPIPASKAWPLASATEREPLPPPAWPLSFGGGNRPFVVSPPTAQDLDPDPAPPPSPEPSRPPAAEPVVEPVVMPVAANEQDAPEPEIEPLVIPNEETLAGAASWPGSPAEILEPAANPTPALMDLVLADPDEEPPRSDVAPLVGLGLLGLVLFLGGLAWSGAAQEGGGPFNPWVVGTLSCLAGVGFMAVSVYFLLLRLGRIARPTDGE